MISGNPGKKGRTRSCPCGPMSCRGDCWDWPPAHTLGFPTAGAQLGVVTEMGKTVAGPRTGDSAEPATGKGGAGPGAPGCPSARLVLWRVKYAPRARVRPALSQVCTETRAAVWSQSPRVSTLSQSCWLGGPWAAAGGSSCPLGCLPPPPQPGQHCHRERLPGEGQQLLRKRASTGWR